MTAAPDEASAAPDTVGFVLPHPGGTPSGGHTYNERVLGEWAALGHPVRAHTVAGAWPHPDDAAREAVAQALRAHPTSLVDGLIGACCPQQIQDATMSGHRVVLLIHLPLADETGLALDQARDLEGLERWACHVASAVAATSWTAARDVLHRHDLPGVSAVPPGAVRQPVAAGTAGTTGAAGTTGTAGTTGAAGTATAEAGPARIGLLASVTPRKNQLGLVAALALIADRAWTAEIVGPQPDPGYARTVHARIDELGLGGRIAMPGILDDGALERFWNRLDLLVLPSLHETYGLVVTEALAHGVPAVVSRGTGAVEALTGSPATADPHDPPGALVDPRSPEDMAAVLGAWLDDPVLRTGWRELALARRGALRPWADAARELWDVVRGADPGSS